MIIEATSIRMEAITGYLKNRQTLTERLVEISKAPGWSGFERPAKTITDAIEVIDVQVQYNCRETGNDEIAELRAALQTAYGLITRHHEAGVRQEAGCFCPVCHREDGTEPEMDQIAAALKLP